MSTVRRLS